MAAHIGKVFENELTKVFNILKAKHLVAWHRLTDSAAAGNLVAAQPSDYLVGFPPGSQLLNDQRLVFLEAKASESYGGLKKAMVKAPQRGAIGSYRLVLGIPYLLLFWDAQAGNMELWDGIGVMRDTKININDRLAVWPNVGVINKLRHEVVAEHLVDHFRIPLSSDTLAKLRQ